MKIFVNTKRKVHLATHTVMQEHPSPTNWQWRDHPFLQTYKEDSVFIKNQLNSFKVWIRLQMSSLLTDLEMNLCGGGREYVCISKFPCTCWQWLSGPLAGSSLTSLLLWQVSPVYSLNRQPAQWRMLPLYCQTVFLQMCSVFVTKDAANS